MIIEEARRWFHQASYASKATRWNIPGGFYDTVCLLTQQAAALEELPLEMVR
jgi:HEPN domain-containing protein